MKISKMISSLAMLITSMAAVAGDMGSMQKFESWYLVGGGGYSESTTIHIKTDPTIWDSADQGYSNNMGSTGLIFFGVGRNVTNYLRMDARVEHRGNYDFTKFQSSTDTSTPNFTSTARIREFQLDSTAVMASAWLDLGHFSDSLLWSINNACAIEPFFGAGLGVDYLSVKNFKTRTNPLGSRPFTYASLNQLNTDSSFAWHLSTGLQTQISERTRLAVGYNYFDGGSIPFPNYLLASATNVASSTQPWQGHFHANEVYAELRVAI